MTFARHFQIDQWAAWAPGISSASDWQSFLSGAKSVDMEQAADVKFLPAMQRRRLSSLARAAFHVTEQVMADSAPCPSIFCSTYGETQRTYGILETIAEDQDISPTAFSLSVHNAISGQYTIFFNNEQPTSALAPSINDYLLPLADGLGWLDENTPSVLLVYYEEALPTFYQPYAESTEFPCAIALRISPGNATNDYQLAYTHTDSPNQPHTNQKSVPILELIQFLAGNENALAIGNWALRKA